MSSPDKNNTAHYSSGVSKNTTAEKNANGSQENKYSNIQENDTSEEENDDIHSYEESNEEEHEENEDDDEEVNGIHYPKLIIKTPDETIDELSQESSEDE